MLVTLESVALQTRFSVEAAAGIRCPTSNLGGDLEGTILSED